MILLIDIGNSRLKAAYYDGQIIEKLEAISIVDLDKLEAFFVALQASQASLSHCYIASVGPVEVEDRVIALIKSLWGILPNSLHSASQCCNLKNGYRLPKQLGVDRWLSLLGAVSNDEAYLVIDAGSALTIDLVSQFEHLGGFITPGLSMMQDSLNLKTQMVVPPVSEQFASDYLGQDTASGINGGTLYMMAAYINSITSEMTAHLSTKLHCIGTGGDFVTIQPLLNHEYLYQEDLVFQGMKKMLESV